MLLLGYISYLCAPGLPFIVHHRKSPSIHIQHFKTAFLNNFRMAPQYDEDSNGRSPEDNYRNGPTTHRPISIPNPTAGDRRSRIGDMDPKSEKRQSMRVNGITISTELFEKMFLLPQKEPKRHLLDNLGNPTPM